MERLLIFTVLLTSCSGSIIQNQTNLANSQSNTTSNPPQGEIKSNANNDAGCDSWRIEANQKQVCTDVPSQFRTNIKKLRKPQRYKIVYHESQNKTDVWLACPDIAPIKSSKIHDSISLRVKAEFEGLELKITPDKFEFLFNSVGRDTRFENNNTLSLILNEDTLRFGKGEYSIRASSTKEIDESMRYKLTGEEFEKIINARTVQIQIGNFKGDLPEEYKQMMHELFAVLNNVTN